MTFFVAARMSIVAATVAGMMAPAICLAQSNEDIAAVNHVIDDYGESEQDFDIRRQGRLMASDRLWASQHFGGRRLDNAANIQVQQAQADGLRAAVPGLRQYVEDLDRVIQFRAGGWVAVANFYRHTTRIFPADTPAATVHALRGNNLSMITLVLERQRDRWTIVASHISDLH